MATRERRIGIRELKSTLSECIREVKAGRTLAEDNASSRSIIVVSAARLGLSVMSLLPRTVREATEAHEALPAEVPGDFARECIGVSNVARKGASYCWLL
jgi:hypothetical protein